MLHADEGFPLTIGADVTIGHHAIVYGCTIGGNTLIGMGATILNGACTGKNGSVANPLLRSFSYYSLNSETEGSVFKGRH
jgi:carbonic anhydrase/acetyltransferase-like protein (isoleucine patch superfamily)